MAMTDSVPVKLSDEARQERQDSLLHHLGEAQRLEAKKAADSKATQVSIAVEWAECYRLRRVLLDDAEDRLQGDLRFGDELVPSTEQATSALAAVAMAAGETLPSEPHAYLGVAAEVDKCAACGSDEADPVHHGGDQTVLRHVYSPAVDGAEGCLCDFDGCGRGAEDELHALGEAVAAAEKQPARATCPACNRGTCEVHAHAFEGEAMKCTRCDKVEKAKIHREPKDGWPDTQPIDPSDDGSLDTEEAAAWAEQQAAMDRNDEIISRETGV